LHSTLSKLIDFPFFCLYRGYLAPELIHNGKITFKSDIYTLGIIIIEILPGDKDCPEVEEVRQVHVPTYRLDAHYPPFYFEGPFLVFETLHTFHY
jgi:serine/threonine protein kinase